MILLEKIFNGICKRDDGWETLTVWNYFIPTDDNVIIIIFYDVIFHKWKNMRTNEYSFINIDVSRKRESF